MGHRTNRAKARGQSKDSPFDWMQLSKPDQVRHWIDRVHSDIRIRQDSGMEKEWKGFVSLYHAEDMELDIGDIDSHNTNFIHKIVSKVLQDINYRDPRFNVTSKTSRPAHLDTSNTVRQWLENFIYTQDLRKDAMEPVVLDALLCGTGIFHTGFREIERKRKRRDQVLAMQERIGAELSAEGRDDQEVSRMVNEMVAAEQGEEPSDVIPPESINDSHDHDDPYIEAVDIFDFYLASGYISLNQAWEGNGYCFRRKVVPWLRANKDPRLKNRSSMDPIHMRLEGVDTDRLHDAGFIDEEGNPLTEFIVMYEIWVAPEPILDRKGMVLVISEGSDKFHHNKPNPYPELKRFPFRDMVFKRRKNNFYGLPYVKPFVKTAFNLDRNRSFAMDVARSIKNLVLVPKGLNEPNETRKVAEAPSGSFLPVRDPDGYKPLNLAVNTEPMEREIARGERDLQFLSDVGPNQAGTPGSDSATEATIIQQNITGGTDAMGDQIGLTWVATGRDLVKILKAKGNPLRILNDAGTTSPWGPFRIQNIEEEYDIRIGAGTQKPVSEDLRRKQLLDLSIGFANAFPGNIDRDRLVIRMFEHFDFPNAQELLIDKSERSQHMETMTMMQGVQVPVSQDDDHFRHINELQIWGKVFRPFIEQLSPEEQEGWRPILEQISKHFQEHQAFIQGQDGQMGAQSGGIQSPGAGQSVASQLAATRGSL